MTLLSICDDAAGECGFDQPSAIVDSTDPNAVRLLALAKRSLQSVARLAPWQALVSENTFTATAAAAQSGAIPSDFDYILPLTCWNRTTKQMIAGPKTAAEWQWLQVNDTATGNGSQKFRIRGDSFLLHPASPNASDTIAYEYVIDTPCEDSSGTAQSTWAADTDVGKISEVLLTLDLKWRLLKSFGRAYDDALNEFLDEADKAIRRDTDAPSKGLATYRDMAKFQDWAGSGYNINTDQF